MFVYFFSRCAAFVRGKVDFHCHFIGQVCTGTTTGYVVFVVIMLSCICCNFVVHVIDVLLCMSLMSLALCKIQAALMVSSKGTPDKNMPYCMSRYTSSLSALRPIYYFISLIAHTQALYPTHISHSYPTHPLTHPYLYSNCH